jgi:hypothetical protein
MGAAMVVVKRSSWSVAGKMRPKQVEVAVTEVDLEAPHANANAHAKPPAAPRGIVTAPGSHLGLALGCSRTAVEHHPTCRQISHLPITKPPPPTHQKDLHSESFKMASDPTISPHSLNDLKTTTDDALGNYLRGLHFTQDNSRLDTRLAIGYLSVIIAAATFAADYKLGWEATKHWTAAAVAAYAVLNGVLTWWMWGVEKGTVFEGGKGGRKVRSLRLAATASSRCKRWVDCFGQRADKSE